MVLDNWVSARNFSFSLASGKIRHEIHELDEFWCWFFKWFCFGLIKRKKDMGNAHVLWSRSIFCAWQATKKPQAFGGMRYGRCLQYVMSSYLAAGALRESSVIPKLGIRIRMMKLFTWSDSPWFKIVANVRRAYLSTNAGCSSRAIFTPLENGRGEAIANGTVNSPRRLSTIASPAFGKQTDMFILTIFDRQNWAK